MAQATYVHATRGLLLLVKGGVTCGFGSNYIACMSEVVHFRFQVMGCACCNRISLSLQQLGTALAPYTLQIS